MENSNKLRIFGGKFRNRLSDQDIDLALEYIDFNEVPLALNTLCSYICEHDVSIAEIEYKEIESLNFNLKFPVESKTISYLKNLIRKHNPRN